MAVILTFVMIFDSFWLQRYKNIFRYQSSLLLFFDFVLYLIEKKEQAEGELGGKEARGKGRKGGIDTS
jgi:hypothetical protein